MADGHATASKVVGSIDFKRPPILHLNEEDLKDRLQVISGVYCSMPYMVKVGASPADRAKLEGLILEVLHQAELTFSLWNSDSEVVAINKMERDTWREISPAMSSVLKVVAIMYKMSRGLFDPAVYPLLKYWKQQIESTPGAVEIKSNDPLTTAIAEYAKWTAFTLSPDGTRLCKSHSQAGLDLGGVAKGWALDELASRITAAGFENCYVDWAGDIKVMGVHPTGRRWTLDVVEPPSMNQLQLPTPLTDIPKQYLASLPLRGGMGCSTSGDYMQVKMHSGDHVYHHIFHPIKHELLQVSSTNLAQATVVAQNCMVADILSTTALVIGDPAEARKFLDRFVSYSLPVDDFLLYARTGPRIIRRRIRGVEAPAAKEERSSHHYPAEVIVVGGGLAGFCAAVEAARAGAKVTLLEKEKVAGGNSAKATSGINGWGTRAQAWAGVYDEEKYFERDTFRSGVGGTSDPSLVRVLSTQSAEAVHWLMDETGIDLSELSQLGGHSRKRTHRAPASGDGGALPVGWYIMQAIQNLVKTQLSDKVTIKTGCRVVRLIREEKQGRPGSSLCKTVTGLVYIEDGKNEEVSMHADAVVLATGGWGCDLSKDSLLQQFRPDIAGMPSTNGAFATGDGVKMARDIGALTIDMDKVQLHPTAFIDPKDPTNPTKVLGPEALRGCGGILINQKGERFCNELDLRSKVSSAILDNCEPYPLPSGEDGTRYAWCVLNEEAQKKFGLSSIRFYKDQRALFEGAKDFETLARDVIKCDPQVLLNTIQHYQESCNQQIDSKTKKNVFPARFSPSDKNLIAARVTPSIHYCMGGLRISPHGQVMEEANIHQGVYHKTRPIRRLFAAGEVTGGVHGENRLGGNSLLECVVFGRVAGERAGTIRQREPYGLKQQEWVPVRFRELLLSDKTYGTNTRVFRFSFDGALQKSGLDVGQFVGIRGELDGEIVQGFYSPISRPTEEGFIEILCRTDTKGGQIINLLNDLRPGAECYLKAMGGLRLTFQDHRLYHMHNSVPRRVRQVNLLAGGTGIAPMAQILRAYLYHQGYAGIEESDIKEGDKEVPKGVRLCYAAECDYDLAFVETMTKIQSQYPHLFEFYIVLNNPPLGWTQGVGFVDDDTVKKYLFYPPRDDQLTVICGPPIFEQKMCELLKSLGFPRQTYYAYSQPIDG